MHEMEKTGQKIPKEYKKTEIGIIPQDWEVKRLEEVCDINPESLSENTPKEFEFNYIPLESIDKGRIKGINKLKFENAPSRARRILKIGDVLFSSVRPYLMSHFFYDDYPKKAICSTGFIVLRAKSESIYNKYIYYHLFFRILNIQIDKIISGSNYPAINSNDVKSFILPIPPLPEQRAIARVLSDFDRLIESLDKLIEKKKKIKKGAMQQLLTGKKRLPGFSGEWIKKKLGEVVNFYKGHDLSKSKLSENGKYECILYGELFTTYKEVIKKVVNRTNIFEGFPSEEGDILFPGSTTTTGIDLAKASALLKGGVLLSGDIIILRKKINFDSIFMAYYLNQVKKYQIAEKTTGITIHHLYGKDLENIEISLPPTLDEQRAIAQILSDMDKEIEALEKKKQKYEQMKKGAMELLLTGKIRLINKKEALS